MLHIRPPLPTSIWWGHSCLSMHVRSISCHHEAIQVVTCQLSMSTLQYNGTSPSFKGVVCRHGHNYYIIVMLSCVEVHIMCIVVCRCMGSLLGWRNETFRHLSLSDEGIEEQEGSLKRRRWEGGGWVGGGQGELVCVPVVAWLLVFWKN